MLEMESVARLWFSKERLPSNLRFFLSLVFTMSDSFTPFQNSSHLSLLAFGDCRLSNYLCTAQSYSRSQLGELYGHFDKSIIRASRQVRNHVGPLFVSDRADAWGEVDGNEWLLVSNVWCCKLDWSELVFANEEDRSTNPEISVLRGEFRRSALPLGDNWWTLLCLFVLVESDFTFIARREMWVSYTAQIRTDENCIEHMNTNLFYCSSGTRDLSLLNENIVYVAKKYLTE